jgi:hypothetical protein
MHKLTRREAVYSPRERLSKPLRESAPTTKQESQNNQHNRYKKKNLRELSRKARNTAKAKKRGNDGDNCKNNGPPKHDISPSTGGFSMSSIAVRFQNQCER